jgi:hypothetical protein
VKVNIDLFAGSWGLVAFILSVGNLHIHFLQKKNKLNEYHTERSLALTGILAFLAALGATIGNQNLFHHSNQSIQ